MLKPAVFCVTATAALFAFAGIKVPCNPDKAVIFLASGEAEKEFVDDAAQFLRELQNGGDGNSEAFKRPEIVMDAKQIPAGKYVWNFGVLPPGVNRAEVKSYKPQEGRWLITDKAAYFYGRDKNGVRIAFYTFMEDAMGVRYPFEKLVVFPKGVCDPLDVSAAQAKGAFAPPVSIRRLRGKDRGGWRWSPRMRDGVYDSPAWGHAFTDWWGRFGATKQHPEYFSQRKDGVRAPVGFDPKKSIDIAASKEKPARYIALCVSNEATVDQVIADWKAKGAPDEIGLCENDCSPENVCWCEKCCALDGKAPTEPYYVSWWFDWRTDRYLNFQKRVLAKAKAINPKVHCTVYAYNPMAQAPQFEKVPPEMEIGIVPTLFTLDWAEKLCKGWKAAGMTKCFYRPNRRGYFHPVYITPGFEQHFFKYWKIFEKYGCRGFLEDCATAETANGWFSDYVLYKAVQDPSKDFAYWEDQYCDAFGAAKEDVKAYFRLYRDIFEKKIVKDLVRLQNDGKCFNYTRGIVMHFKEYYTIADLTEGTKLLDRALAKKDQLSPSQARAVQQLWWAQKHAELTGINLIVGSDETAKALFDFRKSLKGKSEGEIGYLCKQKMIDRPFNSALRGCWDAKGKGDVEHLQRWDVK